MSVQSMLEGLGHTVVAVARNGEDAVTFSGNTDPDLIIMDIKLPKLNGLEAAKIILQRKSIPIIILTAYPEDENIERASKLGIFGFRAKPVRDVDLRSEIKITMDRFFERELLKEKISKLEEWRTSRKLVDKAKGILMDKHSCAEEVAYKSIQKFSRDHCMKMIDTVTLILEGGIIPIIAE